ncbi:MAG: 3-hydroxy-5-methyl-1-naphthoate 3-O-methyltransferase [Candidatus Anoxychlamydiales bacterium]|nr:3-hydroxy-5-methyl-1-naphthoate 3-O-methyltransferase [Candidatus Anoxychlamydiales bacterium]
MHKEFSDEKMQLLTGQIFIGQGILVAFQLGLFSLLLNKPLQIQDIATKLRLSSRAAQSIVSCASAFGFIEFKIQKYKLTLLGESFFSPKSKDYYGDVLNLFIKENEIMNFSNIKKAILTNKSLANKGRPLFEQQSSISNTKKFISALHQKAIKPAFFWTKKYPLNKNKKIIDIGGGSGIHSIAACLTNSQLTGIVCERKKVTLTTKKYINDFNLNSRISVKQIDMWKDNFPRGDIYFFGDIFHDWDEKKCFLLAKKSFELLPKNGKIILHEMLFNNDKTGPLLTSAYNIKMMSWTEGQQYSKIEITKLLKKAGFKKIIILKALGNWSLIIGTKK